MYKVLIIEENKMLSDSLITLINWEEHGFQILGVVSNGIVGRAIMERQKPDIILLSMSTTYLGGKGFIEAVENISYRFSIIQLYSEPSSLVNSKNYSVKISISLNRMGLNPQDLIRALATASADITGGNEDNLNFMVHQPFSVQRNDVILKTLKGITKEEYINVSKQYRLKFHDAQLGVIILYPLNSRYFDKKLLKQLSNIVKSVLFQYEGGEVFITENNQFGVIVKFKELIEKYTQYLFYSLIAEKLCATIKNQMGIDVECVMSDEASDILGIRKIYNTAISLEPYRYFKCATSILTHRYITSNAVKVSLSEIDSCVQKLYEAMCNLDYEGLNREITQLYLSLIKSSIDFTLVKYTRERLLSIYQSCLNEFSLEGDQKNIKIGREKYFTVEQEYYKVKSVFSSLIEKAFEKKENLHPIIRKSTNYINNNYAEDITLDSISKVANVSSVYLSRLFKRELGITFVQYLTRVRVEKSKRLISCGNNKIADIAKSVGYIDEKYFYRVFKKMMGMSPSEFKKMVKTQS